MGQWSGGRKRSRGSGRQQGLPGGSRNNESSGGTASRGAAWAAAELAAHRAALRWLSSDIAGEDFRISWEEFDKTRVLKLWRLEFDQLDADDDGKVRASAPPPPPPHALGWTVDCPAHPGPFPRFVCGFCR